jgi:hypothetical protein
MTSAEIEPKLRRSSQAPPCCRSNYQHSVTCMRIAGVRANGADTATEMWQWRSGAAAGTQQGDGSREDQQYVLQQCAEFGPAHWDFVPRPKSQRQARASGSSPRSEISRIRDLMAMRIVDERAGIGRWRRWRQDGGRNAETRRCHGMAAATAAATTNQWHEIGHVERRSR